MNDQHFEHLRKGFELAGVPADDALDEYIREGTGVLKTRAELMIWDALSIKNFVFDTTNAMTIRGGSAILDGIDQDLNRGEAIGLEAEQIVFAGGGSGMAVVATEKRKEAERALRELFAERTIIASCQVGSIALTEAGSFQGLLKRLHRQVEMARALDAPDLEAGVPFFVSRCKICGSRAVANISLRKDETERPECAVCLPRLEIGKGHAKAETKDYELIAGRTQKLGVMYADGNRFGKLFADLSSPLQYRRLSRTIAKLFRRAFDSAAEELDLVWDHKNQTREGRGFYQRPIFGGDDVVAILPGDLAVEFAIEFLRAVEEQIDQESKANDAFKKILGGRQPGVAAGVAIGGLSYPVRHLFREAESLLARAKKQVYSSGCRSALDFAVIDDGTEPADTEDLPRLDSQPRDFILTGRPYTLEEMQRFRERFWIFKSHLPKSQLHTLAQVAHNGPMQLRNHVLFQIARSTSWKNLITALSGQKPGRSKAQDVAQILGAYDVPYQLFDVADMLMLDRYWRSPEEAS